MKDFNYYIDLEKYHNTTKFQKVVYAMAYLQICNEQLA